MAGAHSSLILHITTREAWQTAAKSGEYRADSLASQGFIHFSTPTQVVKVANALYADRDDLVLLVVDATQVADNLRWEPPDGPGTPGEQFPHLYAPLDVAAVVAVVDFPRGADGSFTLPEAVTSLM